MSTIDKIIQKILTGICISYSDAERVLLSLDFRLKITSSHHVFRKIGYAPVTIKRRAQLLPYQIKILQEVLLNHGYKKEK